MQKHSYRADDIGAIIALGVVLLLIYCAVARHVNSGQTVAGQGKPYGSTESKKTLSLVNWGPLGDSDEEAERTLNAFFGD